MNSKKIYKSLLALLILSSVFLAGCSNTTNSLLSDDDIASDAPAVDSPASETIIEPPEETSEPTPEPAPEPTPVPTPYRTPNPIAPTEEPPAPIDRTPLDELAQTYTVSFVNRALVGDCEDNTDHDALPENAYTPDHAAQDGCVTVFRTYQIKENLDTWNWFRARVSAGYDCTVRLLVYYGSYGYTNKSASRFYLYDLSFDSAAKEYTLTWFEAGGYKHKSYTFLDAGFKDDPLYTLYDLDAEAAIADGCVVTNGHGIEHGLDIWLDFYDNAQNGIAGNVRVVKHLAEPDAYNKTMYVFDIEYDGENYLFREYVDYYLTTTETVYLDENEALLFEDTFHYLTRYEIANPDGTREYSYILSNTAANDYYSYSNGMAHGIPYGIIPYKYTVFHGVEY